MRIGTPKEIKNREFRVALTPHGARELTRAGHQVLIEMGAGVGAGYPDETYVAAGCEIAADAEALFGDAELIVKVKEPQPVEIARLRPHHVLFTYLHLAPDPQQAAGLMASGATCIAYETVTGPSGRLPLLTPMSEVAGRLSVQVGAHLLERAQGGPGVLLGGVSGVAPVRVLVIGGGVAGHNAARMAVGLGADVTVLERSLDRVRELDAYYRGTADILFSTADALEDLLARSELVIGAVLVPGDVAPKVVRKEQLSRMPPGAVLVDVAIDQGGCFETSRPTTHENPVYEVAGIRHYCVTNMPAAVPRTPTQALTAATLPFIAELADRGVTRALELDPYLAAGLNVAAGEIRNPIVAAALAGHR